MSVEPSNAPAVLVIDDQASNLHLHAGVLRKAGYEVDTCDDADAGLKILQHKQYQAVLLDIMLGGKSGLDILHEVRGNPGRNRDTPIIVYTSDASPVNRQQAAVFGASMFLERPIRPMDLLEAVELMVGDDSGDAA